jgi:hypothetical protein
LLTYAENGFKSFETGDYSNEIMELASKAGFAKVVARPYLVASRLHKIPPPLQILTIPALLQRVAFIAAPV